jgi:hypothetical protein
MQWCQSSDGGDVAVLRPAPDGLLHMWPIDRRVGSPRNKGPELLESSTCVPGVWHRDLSCRPDQHPMCKGETERRKVVMPGEGRELYRSPNGDRWLLIRETLSDRVLVRHEPNRPSGGKASVVEVGDFLSRGHGPEQQALLRLIGSLVEADGMPPATQI